MSSSGWISVERDLRGHWLWGKNRKLSKLEAWLDMLIAVNHSAAKVEIKGFIYTVNPGESVMSLDSWARRWNWNKSAVRRFLKLIESDSMIVLESDTVTTRVSVCNYCKYQNKRNADETQTKHKRNTDETQMTLNNNDNKENNENNEKKIKGFNSELKEFSEHCISHYNSKLGDKKKPDSKSTLKQLGVLLKDKVTLEDVKKVIDHKYNEFFVEPGNEYQQGNFKPTTLFAKDNFFRYLDDSDSQIILPGNKNDGSGNKIIYDDGYDENGKIIKGDGSELF